MTKHQELHFRAESFERAQAVVKERSEMLDLEKLKGLLVIHEGPSGKNLMLAWSALPELIAEVERLRAEALTTQVSDLMRPIVEDAEHEVRLVAQARREGAAEALERAAATAAFANTFSPWRLVVPWSDLLDEAAKLREPRKEGGDV